MSLFLNCTVLGKIYCSCAWKLSYIQFEYNNCFNVVQNNESQLVMGTDSSTPRAISLSSSDAQTVLPPLPFQNNANESPFRSPLAVSYLSDSVTSSGASGSGASGSGASGSGSSPSPQFVSLL